MFEDILHTNPLSPFLRPTQCFLPNQGPSASLAPTCPDLYSSYFGVYLLSAAIDAASSMTSGSIDHDSLAQ